MSGTDGFAHLHVASSYSLRYGLASPAALAQRAAELGMPALALTDRDGLYGAVKHAVACTEAGTAAILGADMALAPDDVALGGEAGGPALITARGRHQAGDPDLLLNAQAPVRLHLEGAPRVTLLAASARGWASLCRLVSAAHRTGGRGTPMLTPDLVTDHAEGLVVLLGPASDVGRAAAARRPGLACAVLARWRERAEVAVEVVDHFDAGGTFRAARMLRLSQDAGVPAVLTNGVRYLDQAEGPLAQVLDAARQMVPLGRRHRSPAGGRAYLASGADLAQVAARVCAAGQGVGGAAGLLAATARLAQRCVLDPERDLGIGGRFLPETTGDAAALLRRRCEEGMARRFGGGAAAARRRLDHELAIIAKTGLASYFLTVADTVGLIAGRGIRCSIRGSGAGCLVNYLIGISEINPLDHDLVMERFLSEYRKGLPDIDIDVESARRIEAYRVIFDAYGEQRVACVSMMETYRARSAIRDVAAALGLPPHETDAVAKAFPHVRAAHIRGALAQLPELRASGLAIPQLAGLFRLAEHLDGLPRHIAMHPCGVVLSDVRLLDRTPVERGIEGLPLSQFDKDDVETAGMIKLDVLGVRMQSAMTHALAEVERTTGRRVDIDAVDPHDEPTFEMIRSARTLGCFQIESPGQRELVGKLLPRTIGDLIVDISLFRPGPVNSDMVTPYLEIRHGRRPPCYPHEDLADALAETGGVVVFHEQVLRVVDTMTGCGLSYAEVVRRGLSDEKYREWMGEWFRREARDQGYDGVVVDRVWEVLAAFGAFGFCKAHAAAFAIPTYQSAWLKRHHTAAFYAGVLTHDPGMYPKRVIVADARLFGVPVLPVDVNASAGDWRVEQAGRPPHDGLRPGLSAVKGISEAEVAGIVAGQPYTSLRDFWERAQVSRPVTERLVLIGAFAPLYEGGPTRRDLLSRLGVLDHYRRHVTDFGSTKNPEPDKTTAKTRDQKPEPRAPGGLAPLRGGHSSLPVPGGQLELGFGGGGDGIAEVVGAGELRELSPSERVEAELEVLGIDLSQHVLGFYEGLMGELGVVRSRELRRCWAGERVLVAGVKVATQTPAIRSGLRIIFVTLDDATGPVDLAFFESVQGRCAARVFGSWLLAVRGQVRRVGESVSVNGAECWDLAVLAEIHAAAGTKAVRAAMAAGDVPGAGVTAIARSYPGGARGARDAGGLGPAPRPAAGMVYPNGFSLSPYAETGSPGGEAKDPPRKLWHASPGSSGGWQQRDPLSARPGKSGGASRPAVPTRQASEATAEPVAGLRVT
ncbi:MAG TPA: DNA polymerase III subunit alpha [Streptosporangiaceae bacterium]|nr:DNA polymerase III subunit alpha [Streptosporangiaceae bacterium]